MARDDIQNTDGWRRIMTRRGGGAAAADQEFAATLSAAQVKQLATIAEQGTDDERRHAMRLLHGLVEAGDSRVTAAVRKRWLDAARTAASSGYARSRLGRSAYLILRTYSRPDADRVVLQHDFDSKSDEHEGVVLDLIGVRSPEAIEKLRRLASRPDGVGKAAVRGLERLGLASERTIAALASAWRRNRGSETLSRLYYAYIVNVKVGDPIAPVLKRMGKPSKHTDNRYWYEAKNSSNVVFLQGDEEHGLIAIRKT